ncbi:MAG: hypothetical protein V2G42_04215 [bacterium JZ-2024 1]
MKQLILNQALESLETSYPEGGVTEEVIQEVVQQVIEDLYDYGEMEEEDYNFFTRSIPRLSVQIADSLAEEMETDENLYGVSDEEE